MLDKELEERIKREPNQIIKAYLLVSKLFKNKVDKAGNPYILHLEFVSDNVDTVVEKTAGLLHDVAEDTNVTFKELAILGFSSEVIAIVKILTKDKSISYDDYIANIISSNNLEALRVKYADMTHNYNKERLSLLDSELRERLENKYKEPYVKIKRKIGELEK